MLYFEDKLNTNTIFYEFQVHQLIEEEAARRLADEAVKQVIRFRYIFYMQTTY